MKKILLVEDNELNRMLAARFLRREGYNVVIADDGQKGVDLAASEMPDMILMDIDLPVLSGIDATRKIKESPATKHIPILVLTGHDSPRDVRRAADAGCCGYELKPIAYSRLMQKVNAFLEAGN